MLCLKTSMRGAVQVDKEADADIVVIPYWVDLHCRMSQESELLWDEFNRVSACHSVAARNCPLCG